MPKPQRPQGTTMGQLTETLLKVEEFVKAREKEGGGFAATPNLPATVEDTYHALRIISRTAPLVQTKFSKKIRQQAKLSSFLNSFLEKELELGPRGIFQLFWCMKYCGVLPPEKFMVPVIKDKCLNSPLRENLYFALRIFLEILENDQVQDAMPLMARVPAFPIFTGILRNRMMDLYLDLHLGWKRIHLREASAWFQACQNPDGGFGFMPGTTSYIENCHYALSSMELLGSKPKDMKACENFVMGCRTLSGGFSRNSNAAPFLDATWHAVKTLLSLQKMVQ